MGRTLELVNKLKIAMLRLNVTVSRLLGWVKSKNEFENEAVIKVEDEV